MGIKGTVRRGPDGHIIHANIDTDVIIAEEPPYGLCLTLHFSLAILQFISLDVQNKSPRTPTKHVHTFLLLLVIVFFPPCMLHEGKQN